MLLQTNSYVVPKDRRAEHARLLRRFRQTLARLGCDQFEVYEQAGQNWGTAETGGRFVQIMKFRDRRHQLAVQAGERSDPQAQQLIAEFCDLINFPYQQQHGLFAVGFYNSVLPVGPARGAAHPEEVAVEAPDEIAAAHAAATSAASAEVAPHDQQTYVASVPPAPAEFSGEPVAAHAPAAPEVGEPVAEDAPAAAVESAMREAPVIAEDYPVAEEVPIAPTAPEQPDAFRDEMEALGAALDHEPMTPVAELGEADSDLQGLDLDLSQEPEEMEGDAEAQPIAHSPNGDGALASGNGAAKHDHPDDADTVLADEVHRPEPGDGQGAFDALLDEHAAEPTGSGIGAVLDGLDDADLDVVLPAELIEDDQDPHAEHPHPQPDHAKDRA